MKMVLFVSLKKVSPHPKLFFLFSFKACTPVTGGEKLNKNTFSQLVRVTHLVFFHVPTAQLIQWCVRSPF